MNTPLALHVRGEYRSVEPGKSTLWTAIRIDPAGKGLEAERAPLALALVIDVSGSMNGDPIHHVVQSCEILADLLTERDQLAIVTFGTHAGVLHGLVPVDATGRAAIKAALRTVKADGSTNMHGGMQVGAGLLVGAPAGLRKVMVVMSDGQPNVGLSTARDLAGYVAGLRPLGVSTLGFGVHHDEDVLEAIATAGSGRYAYVPDPRTARVDLARAALAHAGIVADQLELTLDPAEGVEVVRILPAAPVRHGKGGATAAIGDVFVDEGRLYAVELALDVGAGHRGALATVTLRARTPDGAAHVLTAALAVDVRAGAPAIDEAAQRDVMTVQAEAARVEARAHADRRATPAAVALLRQMIARIDALPWFVAGDGSDLAELREQLVDEAASYERASSDLERMHQRKQAMATKLASLHVASARQRTAPAAYLVGVAGPLAGQRLALHDENTIGRSPKNDIAVASDQLSRVHARVIAIDGHYVVQDLGSTSGTFVNRSRVTTHRLAPGDIIQVGDLQLRFEMGTGS